MRGLLFTLASRRVIRSNAADRPGGGLSSGRTMEGTLRAFSIRAHDSCDRPARALALEKRDPASADVAGSDP